MQEDQVVGDAPVPLQLSIVEPERRLSHASNVSGAQIDLYKRPVVAALVGLGVTFAGSHWFAGWTALVIVVAGFALEMAAIAVLLWRQSRDLVNEIRFARADFAVDLDKDAVADLAISSWLQGFDQSERERVQRFLEARLDVFTRRHTLLFGPLEKLGALPVLGALCLQAFGLAPSTNLGNWWWVITAIVIVFYLAAVLLFRFKFQIERYVRFLRLSNQVDA